MSRLLHEIDRNQEQVRTIGGAIADIEMIQALQPDAFSGDAFSVAIDCMRIQRTRLMSHISKLKALYDSPVPERDEVKEALLRQRQAASDYSDYDVLSDAIRAVEGAPIPPKRVRAAKIIVGEDKRGDYS